MNGRRPGTRPGPRWLARSRAPASCRPRPKRGSSSRKCRATPRPSGPPVDDTPPSDRALARLQSLVARRVGGEPLQYVLGSWSFRGLDLMVDPRVLIPRPGDRAGGGGRARRSATPRAAPGAAAASRAGRRGADRGRRRHRNRLGRDRARARCRAPRRRGVGDRRERRRARRRPRQHRGLRRDAGSHRDGLVVRGAARRDARAVRGRRVEPAVRRRGRGPEPPRRSRGLRAARRVGVGSDRDARRSSSCSRTRASGSFREGALVCELAPHQADAMVEQARGLGYAEVFVRADLSGRQRVLVARAG